MLESAHILLRRLDATHTMHELLAAIDLGSNSFRLQVGKIVNDQIYPRDGLKEQVQLAAGLDEGKWLDHDAFLRGFQALGRFNERLRGIPRSAVRAVATNTLRVAKNSAEFIAEAEKVLGIPIEIISGREEARLIYLGVAHTLPDPMRQQLVVDIGGGSTEFIIGKSFEPLLLDSKYMGCVSYSLRFFPDGKIDKASLLEAELAGRHELQTLSRSYRETGWELAVGSSGTAKALLEILEQNGWATGAITADGLERLRTALLKTGHVSKLKLNGLKADRLPVLLGGFSIMYAVFREFGVERMQFSEGALRTGVLYDLLGRHHKQDLRDTTVAAFGKHYDVDKEQAEAVSRTALHLLEHVNPATADSEHPDRRFLGWAARLHEIGVTIFHASYHKHSAYILENADMPGFSSHDQSRLARIVLGHRGKLARVADLENNRQDWPLIVCLRLACLLHRARGVEDTPPAVLEKTNAGFCIRLPAKWLKKRPLTAAALENEQRQWLAFDRGLAVRTTED